MADTKISEMTAATSLADADLVPVVQGGVNKRGTVDLILDGITAARVNTALGYTAANDAALNASNLTSGTVPDARFPATLPAASGVNLTNLVATNIATGLVPTARLGGGTASASTYLRGDQTWATVTAGVDGSGTANQIPTWSDTDTLAGSKMTASGTNGGTWVLYDATLLNGQSALVVREGAGQGSDYSLAVVATDNTTFLARLTGGLGAVFEARAGFGDTLNGLRLSGNLLHLKSGANIHWNANADNIAGSPDTGLARASAGILKVTDGSTGQGGIGIADSATNTVSDALILRHATSGTATTGFGTGLLFQGSNAAGTMRDMVSIDAQWVSATDTNEHSSLVFKNYHGAESTMLTMISQYGETYMITPGQMRLRGSDIQLDSTGGAAIYFALAYDQKWALASPGHWTPLTTNTYDIGTSSGLVRKIYAVTSGVQTANGAESNVKTISESITLSTGGLTTDSTANLLPANSIILAVTARITTTITTTTDWALGDASESARFASANATLTSGTTAVGVNHMKGGVATDALGPVQVSAAKLRITCTGANPGAGTIRVTVTYLELTPPSS